MSDSPIRERFTRLAGSVRRRRTYVAAGVVLMLVVALLGVFGPRPGHDSPALEAAGVRQGQVAGDGEAGTSGDGRTGRDAYLGPQTTVAPPSFDSVLRKNEDEDEEAEADKAGAVTKYPQARPGRLGAVLPGAAGQEFQPAIRWGGRTVAITLRPGTPATAIVASESGGLFRTTNSGNNWAHLDGLAQSRMFDVAYAPTNANVVLAVSNWDTHTTYQGGIWRSTNGGTSWSRPASQSLPCNARGMVWGVSFSPGTSDVWAGTDCGVQISHDLGATWTAVALPTQVFSVVAQSATLVDICSSDGHRRSTNGGSTWSAVHAIGAGCHGYAPHSIAAAPGTSSVLFAMSSASEAYESRNGGVNWTKLSVPGSNLRTPFVVVNKPPGYVSNQVDLWVSNGPTIYRRTCTGTAPICGGAFTAAESDHADLSALAIAPGASCPLLVTGDGGVSGTTDCGAHWTVRGNSGNGLSALQVYEQTNQVHPDHTDYYFGTQDDSLWASGDNGRTWPASICCEGFFLGIPHTSPDDTGQVFTGVACTGCYNFKTAAHFAGQSGWNDPPRAGGGPSGNPFLVSPGVYLQWEVVGSTAALFRTTNTGATWTQVPGVTTNFIRADRIFVTGPAGDPIVYQPVLRADGTRGLLKITGALGSSATVTNADNGLLNIDSFCAGQGAFLCPTSFGVNPRNPNQLFAADIGTHTMKQSRDGGATWTTDAALTAAVTRSGTFRLDGQVRAITADPTNAGRIFIGTEATGVTISEDAGRSWYRIPGTEAIPSISGFTVDEVRNTTVVSSYGRGLWRLSLPRWGYVWADQPTSASYVPAGAYQGNSAGAGNSITRAGVGSYTVHFIGLIDFGGTVDLTAYGSNAMCKVAGWGPLGISQDVRVLCFNASGAPVDTTFTAIYSKPVGNVGTFGHVWANAPTTASYAPDATYSFNSKGQTNTITRSGTGAYDVSLPGLGNPGGTVKVTAYGGDNAYCKVTGWYPSGTVEHVGVACFAASGARMDSMFTMTYSRSLSLLGATGRPGGYVWASQPTTDAYPAPVDYSWNSTGSANSLARLGVGNYQMQLPGLGQSNGDVQVTAYGGGPERCWVNSWYPNGSRLDVNIGCSNPSGTPVDTTFVAQYQR
jgi:hypothetical protein